MKKTRIINTPYYCYNNPNPQNVIAGDCVIRALTIGSHMLYVDVYNQLFCESLRCGYIINEKKCYERWLKKNGWIKMSEPRHYDNTKLNVIEFINDFYKDPTSYNLYDKDNIIAYVGTHHIVAIVDGVVQDTWNSSRETMHTYWIRPKTWRY